jgi:hypothetical protein
VLAEDREIACSESPDQQIVDAAREIDGQLLTTVEADPAKGTSGFAFDAGAKIQTWPWDEGNDEQWMLFIASGDVFTYRADGRYSPWASNRADRRRRVAKPVAGFVGLGWRRAGLRQIMCKNLGHLMIKMTPLPRVRPIPLMITSCLTSEAREPSC